MRLQQRVAATVAQCRTAGAGLAALGFEPEGEGFVRGSLLGAVFSMNPSHCRAHLRFEPSGAGARVVLEVDSRFQVVTATERAFWKRELLAVAEVVGGRALPLVRTEQHAALATVENWAVTLLAFAPAAVVGLAAILAGFAWLVAWLAMSTTLVASLLLWVAWARFRPLTDDERPGG